jgi:hypothetical protein
MPANNSNFPHLNQFQYWPHSLLRNVPGGPEDLDGLVRGGFCSHLFFAQLFDHFPW